MTREQSEALKPGDWVTLGHKFVMVAETDRDHVKIQINPTIRINFHRDYMGEIGVTR